jgi:hypothetical protein
MDVPMDVPEHRRQHGRGSVMSAIPDASRQGPPRPRPGRPAPARPPADPAAEGSLDEVRRQPGDERSAPFVRPYAVVAGRTRSIGEEFEIETLVSTTSLGTASLSTLTLERRSIARLCRDILSIAEIAAKLGVPLGVARVLVGDMAEEGLVAVHRPTSPSDRPDLALLERVLYGLREI